MSSSEESPNAPPAPAAVGARLGAGALCMVGLTALGFSAGGLLGGRVFSSGVGIDRLTDTLGGAAIGILVGLCVSIWAIRQSSVARQVWTGLGGLVLAVASLLVMRILTGTSIALL